MYLKAAQVFLIRRPSLQAFLVDVAKDFAKLIDSAVANAENNLGMDVDELYVHEIYVDKGRVRKAMRARARGRRNIIRKRSSHVVVYLAEKAS